MFRWGVSYSAVESCQEESLVVDERVVVLEVKEVVCYNGLVFASGFYIVVARGDVSLGVSGVRFYELAKGLFSVCVHDVVDGCFLCSFFFFEICFSNLS